MKNHTILKSLFIGLCIILGMSSSMSAQFKVYGKITTEDNKKYHGEVISYEPQKNVTMNCQGEEYTFDLNTNEFKFTTRKPPKKYIFPDGVGYHRIALGVLSGKPQDGTSLSYSYHYQKNRFVGYGGSLAYENYGSTRGYDFIVPRATFFSYFKATNATPFIKADLGYGIAIKNAGKNQIEAQGGLNAGAALGYRLSTNGVMIDLFIGARLQEANYTFDIDFIKKEEIRFSRIELGIGFMW